MEIIVKATLYSGEFLKVQISADFEIHLRHSLHFLLSLLFPVKEMCVSLTVYIFKYTFIRTKIFTKYLQLFMI